MRMKVGVVRIGMIVLAAGILTGCRDVGLLGNMPRERAEMKQFAYVVYQAIEGTGPTSEPVTFDNRSWLASGETVPVPERLMQPVGSADGIEIFAPVWAAAPHARVYVRAEDGHWHPMTPVI